MATIRKRQLVSEMSRTLGIYQHQTTVILEEFLKSVLDQTKKGDHVTILYFGRFERVVKSERMGRNPKTLAPHVINSRNKLAFSFNKTFRKVIESQIRSNGATLPVTNHHAISNVIYDRLKERAGKGVEEVKDITIITDFVSLFVSNLARYLSEGHSLMLKGFGSFQALQVHEAQCRNPKTGESVDKDFVLRLKFKPGCNAVSIDGQ